jgi:hypothetical protein
VCSSDLTSVAAAAGPRNTAAANDASRIRTGICRVVPWTVQVPEAFRSAMVSFCILPLARGGRRRQVRGDLFPLGNRTGNGGFAI